MVCCCRCEKVKLSDQVVNKIYEERRSEEREDRRREERRGQKRRGKLRKGKERRERERRGDERRGEEDERRMNMAGYLHNSWMSYYMS